MHAFAYAFASTSRYTKACMSAYIYIYIYIYILCIHMHIYIYMCACVCVCVCVYLMLMVYICIRSCIEIYIHIHLDIWQAPSQEPTKFFNLHLGNAGSEDSGLGQWLPTRTRFLVYLFAAAKEPVFCQDLPYHSHPNQPEDMASPRYSALSHIPSQPKS